MKGHSDPSSRVSNTLNEQYRVPFIKGHNDPWQIVFPEGGKLVSFRTVICF